MQEVLHPLGVTVWDRELAGLLTVALFTIVCGDMNIICLSWNSNYYLSCEHSERNACWMSGIG